MISSQPTRQTLHSISPTLCFRLLWITALVAACLTSTPAEAQQNNDRNDQRRSDQNAESDRESNNRIQRNQRNQRYQENDRNDDRMQREQRYQDDDRSDDRIRRDQRYQNDDRMIDRDRRNQNDDRAFQRDQRSNRDMVQDRREGTNARSTSVRVDPGSRVTVAIDYNNDDVYDAVETMYYSDLVEARNSSQQRQRRGTTEPNRNARQNANLRMASGELTSLKTIKLSRGEPHQLGKLITEDNQTIPVDFGPLADIRQLALQEGDTVTVRGTVSRINDRQILSAKNVESNGRTMDVSTSNDHNLKRISGTVQGLRSVEFQNRGERYQVATFETQGGNERTVILGPKSKLEDLDIQKNDELKLLVRRARMNDQTVCVAEQINTGERTIQIERSKRDRSATDRRTNRRDSINRR